MTTPDVCTRGGINGYLDRVYETKTGRVLLAPLWAYEHVRDWIVWRQVTALVLLPIGWLACSATFQHVYEVAYAHGVAGLAAPSWWELFVSNGVPLARPSWSALWWGLLFMVVLQVTMETGFVLWRRIYERYKGHRGIWVGWINRRFSAEHNCLVRPGPPPDDGRYLAAEHLGSPLLMVHEAAWRWRMIWGPWKDPANDQPPRLILRLGLLRGELIARWAFPGPTPERRAQYAAWLEPFELVMFDTWVHVRQTDPKGRAARRDWWFRHGVYKEWKPNGAHMPATHTTVVEDYDGGTLVEHGEDEAFRSQSGEFEFVTVAKWTAADDDQGQRVTSDELDGMAVAIVENYQTHGPEAHPLDIENLSESQVRPLNLIIGPAFTPHREIPLSLGELGAIVFEPLPSMQQEIIGHSPETWRVLVPVDVLETSDEPEWLIAARASGAWVIEVDGLGGDGMAAVKIRPAG